MHIVAHGGATPKRPSGNRASLLEVPGAGSMGRDAFSSVVVNENSTASINLYRRCGKFTFQAPGI